MDIRVLLFLNSLSSAVLDTVMIAVTTLGDVVVIVLVTLLIAAFLYKTRRWRPLLFLLISVFGAIAVNSVLKLLVARQRPELWELIVHESTYSFPSGHAAFSLTLALVVVVLTWQTRARNAIIGLAVLYVVAVGVSRMYLGVHYPSDVAAGWIVAIIWVYIAAKIAIVLDKRHLRTDKNIAKSKH